ncbi:uncharacterized protein LOC114876195 isoform X1 [Osmia bicornis bicornis]|uniref:uncharacterized protein LOC114876195 isoform X1 n=2 Tax=Osmia bicornis bicornis TaxID=1437191 RepID=UPI001EAF4E45|nr:uncharacterized protein LOC114876195 isoform X1 [Osmia bicornis bicornis]XP_029043253.2 uncharacterized protein LOC114876195 isoform X1 [Osmia bicornis bicornis]XP_029043261.2 uncharacterized protein LOC114876195 isoform X1 [Osmia bicornis bicornis]
MDEFLTVLAEKYIDVGVGKTATENFYSKGKIFIGKIQLFCQMVKNSPKRYLIEQSQKTELYHLTANIDTLTLQVKQWTIALEEERLDFSRFQKNVEADWKVVKLTKKNIDENLKEKLTAITAEYSSKMLSRNLEHETRKKLLQMDVKLFEDRLKRTSNIRYSRRNELYDACLKAKKVCFDQLKRYDNNIGVLHTCKSTLLIDADVIEKEYFIVQNQLIPQRALYSQLKKECELNAREALLRKVEHYRRNRAAKIIQRYWRFYYIRVSWRKRKGRK